MKTLTEIQQQAVDEILAARPQGQRASCYGFTVLNRNPRVLSGIRRRFTKSAIRLGYQESQAARQYSEVIDMAQLEAAAE